MLLELGIILLLAILNGVFSGAEIAIVTLRKTRLRQLVEEGSVAARAVEKLRSMPERFLATVQVGITVIGASAAAFGGSTIAARLEPALARIPGLEAHANRLALAGVVAVVSFLSLVLGELVPKSLALRAPERYALLLGRPLVGLSWVARPVIRLLTASSNAILRLFGDRTSFTEARMSADELRQLVQEASAAGSVDPRAGDIATRAIDFGDLTAADVMVPRREVVAIAQNSSPAETRTLLLEKEHARLPVYDGSVDNVVGYLSARQALKIAAGGEEVRLEEVVRPAYFVPESMKSVELLRELQKRRSHLAIVVDEQGGMAGIVTMEDIVEELVGEIFSEHDHAKPEPIHREADGSSVVLGSVTVREANRALGLELPEGETWSTIGGLCLALAGRIPDAGTRLTVEDGTSLEIVEASSRRVRSVRIRPAAPAAPTA